MSPASWKLSAATRKTWFRSEVMTSARQQNEPQSAGKKNLLRLKHNSSLSFIIIMEQWWARRTNGTIMREKLRQTGKTLTHAIHRIYQLLNCIWLWFTGNCQPLGMIKDVLMLLLFWIIQKWPNFSSAFLQNPWRATVHVHCPVSPSLPLLLLTGV